MFEWLKRLTGSLGGTAPPSRPRPKVVDLVLDRDWPDVAALIAQEGLPHDRADVAGWLAETGSVALVARVKGQFAGVFLAHRIGSVAHVDLVSVAPEFRRTSVVRPLYYQGVNLLKVAGCTGFVAHARETPGRLLSLLGYDAGDRFLLREREVAGIHAAEVPGQRVSGCDLSLPDACALDAAIMGAPREGWLAALLHRSDTRAWGLHHDGVLTALLVLQRQTDGSEVVRLALGDPYPHLDGLLRGVLASSGGTRVRAWVRDGGPLDHTLQELGFENPPSAVPFTEFRRDVTAGVGDGDGVNQLSWW